MSFFITFLNILGFDLFVPGGAEQELQRASSSSRQGNSWTSGQKLGLYFVPQVNADNFFPRDVLFSFFPGMKNILSSD